MSDSEDIDVVELIRRLIKIDPWIVIDDDLICQYCGARSWMGEDHAIDCTWQIAVEFIREHDA